MTPYNQAAHEFFINNGWEYSHWGAQTEDERASNDNQPLDLERDQYENGFDIVTIDCAGTARYFDDEYVGAKDDEMYQQYLKEGQDYTRY